MSATNQKVELQTLQRVVDEVGVYPIEAYDFVARGLAFTVHGIHGARMPSNTKGRHVTGQQLCEGIRRLALAQWGLLARSVLGRWNITCTMDFGRIVFALVKHGLMSTTDADRMEDFRAVYDFKTAFEIGYRIAPPVLSSESNANSMAGERK